MNSTAYNARSASSLPLETQTGGRVKGQLLLRQRRHTTNAGSDVPPAADEHGGPNYQARRPALFALT